MNSATRISVLAVAALVSLGCDVARGVLVGAHGPDRVISFGYVRPISCRYEGEFVGGSGYQCVMRNQSEGLREVTMECASYDGHGRMMGGATHAVGLHRAVFNPGEERISRLYFDPNSKSAVCVDVRGSIPAYQEALKMAEALQSRGIVSELAL